MTRDLVHLYLAASAAFGAATIIYLVGVVRQLQSKIGDLEGRIRKLNSQNCQLRRGEEFKEEVKA